MPDLDDFDWDLEPRSRRRMDCSREVICGRGLSKTGKDGFFGDVCEARRRGYDLDRDCQEVMSSSPFSEQSDSKKENIGAQDSVIENETLCPSEIAPVVCGPTSEWYVNPCMAKLDGGFDADTNDCTCNEIWALDDLLILAAGSRDNCKETVETVEDVEETQYVCTNPEKNAVMTLVTNLVNGNANVPYLIEVEMLDKDSVEVGKPMQGFMWFDNECSDLEDAQNFLAGYG
ncbi:MAG: hypothetical protein SGARI_001959, partial [Bacillariaceae sp.]